MITILKNAIITAFYFWSGVACVLCSFELGALYATGYTPYAYYLCVGCVACLYLSADFFRLSLAAGNRVFK